MTSQQEDPASDWGRPGETDEQRADRNFIDLLQELRVTQTGVQILFGFLLTLPLQSRFAELDRYEKSLLVIAALSLAVATTCIIAPVAWHRALFRHRLKREIVDAANVFAKCGLSALALGVVTAMMLMLDLVVPRWLALTLSITLAVLILMTWLVAPVLRRRGLSPR